ncbi:LacI family DNA-binding transcriptional regulator [Cupriavidus sp. 2TAF22]|uniref:LacI family DNA-binding transcriptional regulator n=1 Tax=unclassified Cupriavidus TaxID=2640874 RepID=UPI003F908AC9
MATPNQMPAEKKRITVLDVARHAGVSQGTVSRVITGKNWVSEEARQLVEASVRELGYVPNPMAQGLKSQRSKAVAALVSDISNPLHGVFLAAAEEVLDEAGYLLFVSSTHSQPQREVALLNAYGSGRVDGLIVAHADEADKKVAQVLEASKLPIVFHDRESHGMGDAVIADHMSGALEATRYLLGLGHKRIAVLTPASRIRPGRERLRGYEMALAESGIALDPSLICELDASGHEAYSQTRGLLEQGTCPTAVICLGTGMLAGVLSAIASSGLKIPEEISLIGVGDTDLVRLHTPPITSLKWDIGECGRIAARMLLARLRGGTPPDVKAETARVPVELVIRHSCAPPRARN